VTTRDISCTIGNVATIVAEMSTLTGSVKQKSEELARLSSSTSLAMGAVGSVVAEAVETSYSIGEVVSKALHATQAMVQATAEMEREFKHMDTMSVQQAELVSRYH
jgi:methyl-accepting chemotaxis protein